MKRALHSFAALIICISSLGAESIVFEESFEDIAKSMLPEDRNWDLQKKNKGQGSFGNRPWVSPEGSVYIGTFTHNNPKSDKFRQMCILTQRSFQPKPGETLEFHIRARAATQHSKGIIFSLSLSNELNTGLPPLLNRLDIQLLTNLNLNERRDKARIQFYSSWNTLDRKHNVSGDPVHGTQKISVRELKSDTAQFNTYIIRWSEQKLEFYLDRENELRPIYIAGFHGKSVPIEPMRIGLSAWVAPKFDRLAYNPELTLRPEPFKVIRNIVEIDSVKVIKK